MVLHGDSRKGIYYAFPFLTGVRPSEQLALQWRDVDFASGAIHIRRMVRRMEGYARSQRPLPACVKSFFAVAIGTDASMAIRLSVYHDPLGHVFPCLGQPGCLSEKKEPLFHMSIF